jgi:DNA modification methylase
MLSTTVAELIIVYLAVDALSPYQRNARTHSKRQIRQIADSILAFGFTSPVLIDANKRIIAGHARVLAAKLLGIQMIPTIQLEGLSPAQLRAYIIADNRLAEKSGWDREILAIEIRELLSIDDILDITLTGFDPSEIDLILEEAECNQAADDDLTGLELGAPVARQGDLWKLGKHRIQCGNALDEVAFAALMGAVKANLVFTDPPYNVAIEGNVSGKGKVRHRNFVMACGEMSDQEFRAFLNAALRLLVKHSTSGSVHFVAMDWRHMLHLLAAAEEIYGALLNLCVWAKDKGGMGSLYRSQHELIFVFKNGKGKHKNNVQLGAYGRDRTNVWRYPSASTFSRQGEEGNLLAAHPTVKPVAMIADAILDCSVRGDVVLDPFLGSGSTLIAAERTGRVCHGIELDPRYVDVAIRRWERHTGEHAVHAVTGEHFSQRSAADEVAHA